MKQIGAGVVGMDIRALIAGGVDIARVTRIVADQLARRRSGNIEIQPVINTGEGAGCADILVDDEITAIDQVRKVEIAKDQRGHPRCR